MLTFPHFEPHFPRELWTLPAMLANQVKNDPDRPYLQWEHTGTPQSFGEVDEITNRVANGFATNGVAKGDFVGLLMPNCVEFIHSWFALTKLGAVEVGISDAYIGSFLAHPLNLSKAKVLVTTTQLANRLVEIEGDLGYLEKVFIVPDPQTDADFEVPSFKKLQTLPYAELM